ncbi:hypothetical protein ACIQPR_48850 [Streptomyces sp. NPDC091280]|uniref:hypothetical protein n=1 Tax=Streptomyces sp. NPDC091280 TaxID=3365984 RepID=UPI003814E60C
MSQRAKRVALSALTTFAAVASLSIATMPQASAINEVECGVRTDLALVYGHSQDYPDNSWCFANAGEARWSGAYVRVAWMEQLSTGNNVVQWHGDGRWQPDSPIGKWTIYTWPNNPGGVSVDGLKIY